MKSRATPPTDASPAAPKALAWLVLAAGAGLGVAVAADGPWRGGQAPAPFAWLDVALVHLVCALPLGLMLAALARGRLSPPVAAGAAAGALALGLTPMLEGAWPAGADLLRAEPRIGYALRALPALGVALWGALVAAALAGSRPAASVSIRWKPALGLGVLGLAALLLAPATYVEARCRHDAARLGELLGQSRFGEARVVARGLLVLDPVRVWNGRPLPEVADEIDRVVANLEERVARPPRAYPTARERLDRARALAMLGRTDEALDTLAPLDDPLSKPEAESLRGTIYEARGDWEEGLAAYQAAGAAWEARPESPAHAAGILRATTGTAYCLRKLGRYAEAEAAYQRVLSLSPTADSHFLLAQFYEDSQQAAKAREHARRAIEMDPRRYARDGGRLIRKLSVYQFGCLGVFEAEGFGAPATGSDEGLNRIR